jgi:hypothetical protein
MCMCVRVQVDTFVQLGNSSTLVLLCIGARVRVCARVGVRVCLLRVHTHWSVGSPFSPCCSACVCHQRTSRLSHPVLSLFHSHAHVSLLFLNVLVSHSLRLCHFVGVDEQLLTSMSVLFDANLTLRTIRRNKVVHASSAAHRHHHDIVLLVLLALLLRALSPRVRLRPRPHTRAPQQVIAKQLSAIVKMLISTCRVIVVWVTGTQLFACLLAQVCVCVCVCVCV